MKTVHHRQKGMEVCQQVNRGRWVGGGSGGAQGHTAATWLLVHEDATFACSLRPADLSVGGRQRAAVWSRSDALTPSHLWLRGQELLL